MKLLLFNFVLFEKEKQFHIVQLIIGFETNIKCFHCNSYILGCPKSLFGFFHAILWKNPNELFGKPNNIILLE